MLTVDQIKNTVSEYFRDKPVKTVYLFGSYARGEAKEDSDVDLLVDLDYDKKIGLEFMRWWLTLEKKFKKKIDLVPLDVAYAKILESANTDKILMYQVP